MSWNIDVISTNLVLTEMQATTLVNILEKTWDQYDTYLDWAGKRSKKTLAEFFKDVQFIEDFKEGMDYFKGKAFQDAMLSIGAEGDVTLASFDGDNEGEAWTHEFKNGQYEYCDGYTEGLTDGRIASSLVVKTPYGWHVEEYHVKKGNVVRDVFSRTEPTNLSSTVKGCAYRITPVFTA